MKIENQLRLEVQLFKEVFGGIKAYFLLKVGPEVIQVEIVNLICHFEN